MCAHCNLQHAAGVAGDEDVCAGGGDVVHFAVEQLLGDFLVGEVVDACAATAPVGFFEVYDGETRQGFQELAGLLFDFLSV